MRKITFLKSLLLLCALMAGVGSAWADGHTGTITFGTNDVKINSASVTGNDDLVNEWTITTEGTTSFTGNTNYYQVGSSSKPANSITFTTTLSEDVEISAMSAKFGGFNGTAGTITLKVDDTSVGTGSLNATNDVTVSSTSSATGKVLTVTVTGISKGVKCYNISYTYSDAGGGSSLANSDLALTGAPVALNFDLYNNSDAQVINYTTSSTGTVTVSDNDYVTTSVNEAAKTITVTPKTSVTPSTQTLTVGQAADESYKAGSVSFTVSITNSDPNVPGTENNPYTVAQARAAIDAGAGVTGVYATGIVSEIVTAYNSSYGNITYNISADGLTTSDQLQAFRGKDKDGANFKSEDDVQVGDIVVVYGDLTKYGSTYEFAQDNQLVSLNRPAPKADPELSYVTTTFNVNLGEVKSFVAPTLTNPHSLTITYSSDDETLALVDENTGDVALENKEGTVTITATFAGNESYKAGSASYSITISDPNKKGTASNPYTVAEVIGGTAAGSGIYVKGFIVGEYVGKTTNPRTSEFTTDANIAIADEFTTSPTAGASIPVALPTDALKTAWGNKTNNGSLLGYEVLLKGDKDTYFSVNGVKNTTEVTAISVPAKVTSAGWATWVAPFNVEVPAGVDAYYVSTADTKSATLAEVLTIPAGEAVILKGEGTHRFDVISAGDLITPAPDNQLKISDGSAKDNIYVLYNGSEGVGMYKWYGDALDKGRVYLPATAGAPEFIALGGETTGIDMVQGSSIKVQDPEIYNLAGQRVARPTKGLYIVNGKKVVIR